MGVLRKRRFGGGEIKTTAAYDHVQKIPRTRSGSVDIANAMPPGGLPTTEFPTLSGRVPLSIGTWQRPKPTRKFNKRCTFVCTKN